jgi:glucose-6-phosphate dehydrogenase assembly protein OpcA
VALSRRTVRECLAEELRRLDPDEIFREALENLPPTGSRRSSRAKAKA